MAQWVPAVKPDGLRSVSEICMANGKSHSQKLCFVYVPGHVYTHTQKCKKILKDGVFLRGVIISQAWELEETAIADRVKKKGPALCCTPTGE